MSGAPRKLVISKKQMTDVVANTDVNDAVVVNKPATKKKVAKKDISVEAVPVVEVVQEPLVVATVAPVVVDVTPVVKTNSKHVSKGKIVAKSPAKKSPAKKSPAKKSPAKKSPAKKSPAKKSPAKKAKKAKTRSAKKVKGKVVKKPTSKRAHNTKPATMDTTGIGIGPARVKAVLMNISLNPREFAVRNAILLAENRPRKPKPTTEDPNPVMPKQGPQVSIDKLDARTLAVVREAEAAHELSMREAYERNRVSKVLDDNARADYNTKRKEAQAALEKTNEESKTKVEFNLQAFNTSFDKNFYNDYAAYKTEHDSYVVGEKYNDWTRAMTLVNKLCTRLSGNTRNIIACFLDRIVEQYAMNGIHNCLLEGRHIVQLRHALTQTDGFVDRVPLNPFASTLTNYTQALDWIENCRSIKEEVKARKADGQNVESEQPEYPEPEPKYAYDFEGYVGEICRSVKMRMAEQKSTDAEKALYLETSVSREFKQFCSYIVYESILRIGRSLRLSVKRQGVKTISDAMVLYVLEQIHTICGIEYDGTDSSMNDRLKHFAVWRAQRKEERKIKREAGTTDDAESDDADDADVDAEHDAEADDATVEVEADDDDEDDEPAEVSVEVEDDADDAEAMGDVVVTYDDK